MKFICHILLFVVAAMAVNYKPHYNLHDAPALFEKYIIDYNRNYKDDEDKAAHYEAFVKNLKEINKLNAEYPTDGATYDINKFTDYTPEETKTLFGYKELSKYLVILNK